MFRKFKKFINHQKLFNKKDKILLAVSGGIDSVVMCELFYLADYNFAIAHCNFQLRSSESDEDELFVKELAEKYNVPFYVKRFNTLEYSKENNISIQMAARKLRYNWFDEILKKYCLNYIATAHHQNDQIETFFINLIRGTGLSGLHGILPKQNNIIHPLLFVKKSEIQSFATINNIFFREDSSNSTVKYLRNSIRHQIIPVFKQLAGDFEKTMIENIEKIRETEIIFNEMIELKRNNLVINESDRTLISLNELKNLKPLKTYLYHFLSPFNFNNDLIDSIVENVDDISGKQFFSNTHRIVKDRDFLIITNLKETPDNCEFGYIYQDTTIITSPINIDFRITTESEIIKINTDKNYAYFDFGKLEFPLLLRKWKKGDYFYPFGMKGKKKLSDYFVDQKLSILEKENIWILCSGNDIIWVVGLRTDDRFKITGNTKTGFIAKYNL